MSPRLVMLPLDKITTALPDSGTIYDIGCGAGSTTRYIAVHKKHARVIGIDAHKGKITTAQTAPLVDTVSFVHGDALGYHYKNCTGAILSDFLHHIPYTQQEQLLGKLSKAMQKKSVLVVKEIDQSDTLRAALSRLWDFLLYPRDRIFYRHAKAWKELLQRFGFQVSYSKEVWWFPGSTTLLIGRKK